MLAITMKATPNLKRKTCKMLIYVEQSETSPQLFGCHSERSEESPHLSQEILRFSQDDEVSQDQGDLV
jgi:hypothetical protein